MATKQGIQIGAIITIATFVFGGGGTFAVWAADQRYTKKEDIQELAAQVESNVAAQAAQSASVDVLLVTMLDMRIRELEGDIADLEDLEEAGELTPAGEDRLRDLGKELEDAEAERKVVRARILARSE